MTADEFWELMAEAERQAADRLVQFVVEPQGVRVWAWEIADWSPVRSAAVDDDTRAYYHVLSMSQARVC